MKTIIILLFAITTLSAQRPPDEYVSSFTKGSDVNTALLKAAAAITGSGTLNQLAYFTGTSTIGSLATATYPTFS